MRRTGLTRRRALAMAATAAGAPAALAGCSGSGPGGGERGGGSRPSAAELARRAEAALRRRSAGVSGVLLAGYDEVLGAHPALGARLSPLREATARHVAALAPSGEGGRGTASPGAAAPTAPADSGAVTAPADSGVVTAPADSGAVAPSAGASSAAVAPGRAGTASAGSGGGAFPRGVPAEPGAALGELAALASRTAAAHTAALVGAPPELARLLASVAAAGAAHAYLLGEGDGA
ncbi:hypothetical protein AB0H29_23215 [Streptomyces thermolilacinus]